MPFLSQTKFPRLWLFMQQTIGCNGSKKQLALKHYRGERNVLEIGCSVGNISEAFLPFKDISFTGIDIDAAAIALAKKRFSAHPNFAFSLISLEELVRSGKTFEYVLFAGMLHHIDDALSRTMLADALKLLTPNGKLIISEPEALKPTDNIIFRQFYGHLEQGQFLRSRPELETLIESAGAKIISSEDHDMSPGIVKRPYVARFNLIVAQA